MIPVRNVKIRIVIVNMHTGTAEANQLSSTKRPLAAATVIDTDPALPSPTKIRHCTDLGKKRPIELPAAYRISNILPPSKGLPGVTLFGSRKLESTAARGEDGTDGSLRDREGGVGLMGKVRAGKKRSVERNRSRSSSPEDVKPTGITEGIDRSHDVGFVLKIDSVVYR